MGVLDKLATNMTVDESFEAQFHYNQMPIQGLSQIDDCPDALRRVRNRHEPWKYEHRVHVDDSNRVETLTTVLITNTLMYAALFIDDGPTSQIIETNCHFPLPTAAESILVATIKSNDHEWPRLVCRLTLPYSKMRQPLHIQGHPSYTALHSLAVKHRGNMARHLPVQ